MHKLQREERFGDCGSNRNDGRMKGEITNQTSNKKELTLLLSIHTVVSVLCQVRNDRGKRSDKGR
ncbi:MAG: hypothetical protein PHI48_01855 [Bacteroidales bacterium]|nr:hypothetical protein [Bacteroidales bacterium]MDD4821292.1 hypothetical protein [Bacteroidales bacterium]